MDREDLFCADDNFFCFCSFCIVPRCHPGDHQLRVEDGGVEVECSGVKVDRSSVTVECSGVKAGRSFRCEG